MEPTFALILAFFGGALFELIKQKREQKTRDKLKDIVFDSDPIDAEALTRRLNEKIINHL